MQKIVPGGLFVTFEGIDGSGKSTQLIQAATALDQAGYSVLSTRNPGGMPFGQELRQILLHFPGQVNPISELLLFIADRTQHMSEVVLPALAAGQIVLCDRHIDSSVAYQGYGRGLDVDEIHRLNTLALQGRPPNLTLLFDGPIDVLARRVSDRGEADRLEGETQTFFTKVQAGYRQLAEANPRRIVTLDATQSLETLHAQVMAALDARLGCAAQKPD